MNAGREDFLERLLTGELAEDSDEAGRGFVQDPEARSELEQLRRAEASLRRAGDEHRDILEEAAQVSDAPGEDAVAGLLERHLGQQGAAPGPPARPTRMPWLFPLAAAAAVLLFVWWRPFAGPDRGGDGPGPVMGSVLSELSPAGEVDDFSHFEWRSDAGPLHHYQVLVFDAEAPEGSPAIDGSPELEEPRWNPNPEQHRSWPRVIRWEVTVYEGMDPQEFESAVASRRSP